MCVALTFGALIAWGSASSGTALAAGTHFQRGDVLASVSGGIDLYRPNGTLKSTFASGSGAGSLCFDPSGKHLVAPGAGLFDSSGNLLPSRWGTLASSYGECAVDRSRHVYVAQGPSGGDRVSGFWGTIQKYSLTGRLLRSYRVSTNGNASTHSVASLDLAPDKCTLYYDMEGGDGVYRFDACTNTQECPLVLQAPGCNPDAGINGLSGDDQLRVLPDHRVAMVSDNGAELDSPSGSLIHGWGSQTFVGRGDSLRWMSLDPGGTSIWVAALDAGSCLGFGAPPNNTVWRLDINTKQVLSAWSVGCGLSPGTKSPFQLNGIAVYSPQLIRVGLASRG